MINCYIPSKDRAAQCDLLLRSLNQNAPGLFRPTVVYTYSSQKYKEGYDRLIDLWQDNVQFQYEYNPEGQFYSFLEDNAKNNDLIGLFADDCIFYRPDSVGEARIRTAFDTYASDKLFSFTYRLGKNITVKDYVINEPAIQPDEWHVWGKILAWDYTKIDFWQIFGFTVGFDGYIYRAQDLLDLSDHDSFNNRICFWEKMICTKFREKGSTKKFMACSEESCVYVSQINTTHEFLHRTNGMFNISTEEINNKWLDGCEISLESMDFSAVNCTHGEIKFSMDRM